MDKIGAIILGGMRGEHRHYFDSEIEEMAHVAGLLRAEMTTVGVLANPLGAGDLGIDNPSYGNYHQSFVILPSAVGGPFAVGTLMELVTPYNGPGTTTPPTLVNCQPSQTTVDNKLLGPMVGSSTGRSANSATTIPAGSLCGVLRLGVAQILCDGATTAGQTLIQSITTAGQAHSTASPVTGQTIGTVLQTIASTGLAWADIAKS